MANHTITITFENGTINTDGPIDQPLVFLGMLDYARMMVFDNERKKRESLIKPSKTIEIPGKGRMELFNNPGNGG